MLGNELIYINIKQNKNLSAFTCGRWEFCTVIFMVAVNLLKLFPIGGLLT